MPEHGFSLTLILEYFTQWMLLAYKNNKKVGSGCLHKKTKGLKHTKKSVQKKYLIFPSFNEDVEQVI